MNKKLKIYGENGFRFRFFAALIVLVLVNSQLTTVYFIPQVWVNLKTENKVKTAILTLNVVNDQLVTFFVPSECLSAKICCSWSSDKFAKHATCEFFSALFLLLVGSGPKRSISIEKLGSSSLVSSIFQREGKLHCSLTGRKLCSHE